MSNINYTGINRNFPVAGQDNDTQVFKDNWDVIATSLQTAKEEITILQDNVVRTDFDSNDFEKHVINNAVLQNVRDQKFDGGAPSENITVDFENGPYQIYRFGADVEVDFLNFPGDPVFTDETVPIGVGKVTLELYGDGGTNVAATSFINGKTYTITVLGDTNWELVGAGSGASVGDVFVAEVADPSSTTGFATQHRDVNFVTSGGTTIKKNGFPRTLNLVSLISTQNPIFIEVWRHSEETIFMRYIGEFA